MNKPVCQSNYFEFEFNDINRSIKIILYCLLGGKVNFG